MGHMGAAHFNIYRIFHIETRIATRRSLLQMVFRNDDCVRMCTLLAYITRCASEALLCILDRVQQVTDAIFHGTHISDVAAVWNTLWITIEAFWKLATIMTDSLSIQSRPRLTCTPCSGPDIFAAHGMRLKNAEMVLFAHLGATQLICIVRQLFACRQEFFIRLKLLHVHRETFYAKVFGHRVLHDASLEFDIFLGESIFQTGTHFCFGRFNIVGSNVYTTAAQQSENVCQSWHNRYACRETKRRKRDFF